MSGFKMVLNLKPIHYFYETCLTLFNYTIYTIYSVVQMNIFECPQASSNQILSLEEELDLYLLFTRSLSSLQFPSLSFPAIDEVGRAEF